MSEQEVRALTISIFGDGAGSAAILGNIAVETGGSFDYQQRQDRGGPGRGLFQMEGPMWQAYERWLGERADSAENQLRYVHHELQTGQHIGPGHARAIRDAFDSGDVARATTEFCNRFERPGIPHLERRLQAAQRFAPAPPPR